MCQDWTRTEVGLGQGWVRIWIRFGQYWTRIGSGMGQDCRRIGVGLGLEWAWIGPGLGQDCDRIGQDWDKIEAVLNQICTILYFVLISI